MVGLVLLVIAMATIIEKVIAIQVIVVIMIIMMITNELQEHKTQAASKAAVSPPLQEAAANHTKAETK